MTDTATRNRSDGSELALYDPATYTNGFPYERFRALARIGDAGDRIRCHGDFHLGQVLLADGDVIFVDFEGEPDRFLEERRLKVTPLRDIADMLQSIRLVGMEAAARPREVSERPAEQIA